MTIHDLDPSVRVSFLKAYLDSYRWPGALDDHPDIRAAQIEDPGAFQDGVALRKALEFVYSASSAELKSDLDAYDAVVARLNAKYGPDFAVPSDGNRDLGLRAFRVGSFGRETEVERQPDGTTSVTVTDLSAQTADMNEAESGAQDD